MERTATQNAALAFSGAPTHVDAGELSEAESYRRLAAGASWWGTPLLPQRVLVEEYALDSLQNLLYSLALHRLTYGEYPERVAVLGWGFKEQRFRLHARAIGWTRAFDYVAVNDPSAADGALESAREGEAVKCRALVDDPLLVGTRWREERKRRNHTGRREPYTAQLTELKALASGLGTKPTW